MTPTSLSLDNIFNPEQLAQVTAWEPEPPRDGCCLDLLPKDLFTIIFSYLPFKSFMAFSLTCRKFRAIGGAIFLQNAAFVAKVVTRLVAHPKAPPFPFWGGPVQIGLSLTLPRVRTLAVLERCTNITALHVLDAQVSALQVSQLLQKAPQLKSLDFWHFMQVGDRDLAKVPFPPTLIDCRFMGANVGSRTVQKVFQSCQSLEKLSLRDCKPISKGAFSLHANLRVLEFFRAQLTDDTLSHILKCCPRLYRLLLPSCSGFDGSAIANFAALEALEELNVNSTGLQGEFYRNIVSRAKGLVVLNVGFSSTIACEDFAAPEYPRTLKQFHANWTDIDDRGVMRIFKTASLELCNLSDCYNLSNELLTRLKDVSAKEKSLLCSTKGSLF